MLKEHNLNLHYMTNHEYRYGNLSDEECTREPDALLVKLKTHQGPFAKLHTAIDAAVSQTGKFVLCARKIFFPIKFVHLEKPSSHLLPI